MMGVDNIEGSVFDKEFEGGKVSASLSDDKLKLFIDVSLEEGFEISPAKI